MKKSVLGILAATALLVSTLYSVVPTIAETADVTAAADVGVTTSATATTTTEEDGYYLPGYGYGDNTTTGGMVTRTTTKKTSTTGTIGINTTITIGTTTSNSLEDVETDGSTNDLYNRDLYYEQNKNVPMPTRKLDNNAVTVFSWRDQQSDNCYGGNKPDMRKVYKEVGLETRWYQATHANYMDALAAAVASGSAPDLVEWNATKMYPAAIASGLVVPIDPYVDWHDDIWDDVHKLTAKYQIGGNTYFSFEYFRIAELLYYDPTIIKAAGLKTPLELWREGNWTLKELQKIADATVKHDSQGNVTRYGFVPGNIGAITGLEMVEYSRSHGYKLNIANAKYKTLMNIMYQMGINGTHSAGFTTPSNVGKGSAVMSMTADWAMINEMNDARVNGRLEWCVIPKLDDKSEHYYNLTMQQTFGLIKGAQNPEGGAYLIELRKWAFLNHPWADVLPFTDTAYTRRYGEKTTNSGSGDQGCLTAAELAYTQELLSQDYDVVANNLWGGWVGNSQFPGISEVISNGNQWSTVLANKKATMEAVLKQWNFTGGGGSTPSCSHNWEEATCLLPETCSKCGATWGEALGHTWPTGVPCPEAGTCTVCGVTEERTHTWREATCTRPETCAYCGVTSGEALGHVYHGSNRCDTCGEIDESVFLYEVEDGFATILMYSGTRQTDLFVPDTLGGYPVTRIGLYAFAGNEYLISVTVPEGITRIEAGAFENCTRLQSVHLPNSLLTMEAGTFFGCDRVALYANCYNSYIAEYAEYYGIACELVHHWQSASCTAPKTCTVCTMTEGEPLPHIWTEATCSIPAYCVRCDVEGDTLPHTYDTNNRCTVCGGFDESVFSYVVDGGTATVTGYTGTAWADLIVPDRLGGYRVTDIGGSAFAGCDTVSSITLPYGVNYIGFGAFENTTIQAVHLPTSITYMEADAFAGSADLVLYSSCYNSYIGEYAEYYGVACQLAHTWREATCKTPRTCTACTLTEGYPLGHTWTDATCTLPRHCTVCYWATGTALGHGYRSATCTTPAYCSFCGDVYGRAPGHNYAHGFCTECGEADPTPAAARLVVESTTAAPGDVVRLSLTVESPDAIKSLALHNFTYDTDKMELLSGEWANLGAAIANWNEAKQTAVLTFSESKELNTVVFTLCFRIKEGLKPCELSVGCSVVAKTVDGGSEVNLPMSVVTGTVQVGVTGDMDGDGVLDANDAIYLLYHFMLPDLYPLTAPADVDGNGKMDSNDAIYLLYASLLPEQYPLYERK